MGRQSTAMTMSQESFPIYGKRESQLLNAHLPPCATMVYTPRRISYAVL